MKINSEIQFGDFINKRFSQTDIKNEPMLFNCDDKFAYENGGQITKTFIEQFRLENPDIKHFIIDSRSHMLMEGWYPCIPGYHHDDVPRDRSDKQPEYINPSYRSKHCMLLINGDICPTEFAIGECDLEIPEIGQTIYKVWHPEIVELLNKNNLKKTFAPSDKLVYFNDRSFHQGSAAIGNGWRWFGRISWDTNRKPTNEIRNQVQVYLEFPMEGW